VSATDALRARPVSIVALVLVMLAGAARAELVADNSGTILISAAGSASYSVDSSALPAITLEDAVSPSLSGAEFFLTIQIPPVQEPAFALPARVVFEPVQQGWAAMGEEPGSLAAVNTFAPVPEPSTWCAGLLALAALLWPLSRRWWCRQPPHLNL
jgi:hypothetical protein